MDIREVLYWKISDVIFVYLYSYIVTSEPPRFVDVALSFPLLIPILLLSCYWKLKICYSVTFWRWCVS